MQALQALTICFAGLTLGKLLWGVLTLALPKSRMRSAANALWMLNSLLQGAAHWLGRPAAGMGGRLPASCLLACSITKAAHPPRHPPTAAAGNCLHAAALPFNASAAAAAAAAARCC
jgi:hypothetical protein